MINETIRFYEHIKQFIKNRNLEEIERNWVYMTEKIYNGYVFTGNEKEKVKMNLDIYNELIKKYKVEINLDTKKIKNLDYLDLAIVRKAEYLRSTYNIIKNNTDLSTDEILLICDGGNLCFGGFKKSETEFIVYED